MVEKQKMSKDQQTFYWCNICNYTIKLAFLLHNYNKSCERDKETNYAVDGHGLANNYERKIQGLTNFKTTFVMVK